MIRVTYWNNIPSPYMVDRFNAVARRGNVELEAWFSARRTRDRSWKVEESAWQFPYRYLPPPGTSALALPLPLVHGRAPDVFVSLYAGPDYLAGSALARRRGARTAFWVEVTYDAWIRRRWWKEALKSHFLPRADGILTAGNDGRAFAKKLGVADERLHNVPHVIESEHFARGAQLGPTERDRVRAELGVRGVTFVYVGRLWTGKGLTYLLDAFAQLQQTQAVEVSLLLVGDGVDEELLRAQVLANGLHNVVFRGFEHYDVLPRLYASADVFVFPTLGDPFGMVVLEAMACRLPVIATTASGEIADRVVEGENGYLVPPADAAALCGQMSRLAHDHALRRRMGDASGERVAGQSPAQWADAFEHAVAKVLGMPRARDARTSRGERIPGPAGSRSR